MDGIVHYENHISSKSLLQLQLQNGSRHDVTEREDRTVVEPSKEGHMESDWGGGLQVFLDIWYLYKQGE